MDKILSILSQAKNCIIACWWSWRQFGDSSHMKQAMQFRSELPPPTPKFPNCYFQSSHVYHQVTVQVNFLKQKPSPEDHQQQRSVWYVTTATTPPTQH